jgi:hypothetical protein
MMGWIYLMVVKYMVTYASFVWWRKSGEATTGAMLQKIQRLACLLTTGAMKSAPTKALEAMLELPPLPDTVKNEAAQSTVRLLDEIKPKAGDMQRHLDIYRDFKEIVELQVLSDKMPVQHDFKAPFEVSTTEREECVNQTTSPGTDGSKKNGVVGMGIYGSSIRYFEALRSSPTIFRAELYAINVCARICLTEGGNEGKHNYIMSESQRGGFKGTKGSHLQV